MSERCPYCGSLMTAPHLKNCKLVKSNHLIKDKPTSAMIEFAKDLIQQLGYDQESYKVNDMSYIECAKLLDELKEERG
ncbi:MAG: hypothetical protein K0Q77_54 [Anaerosporomusa subterranea]|nr:hypothetical protein [Anaerosporomusa subterranea]